MCAVVKVVDLLVVAGGVFEKAPLLVLSSSDGDELDRVVTIISFFWKHQLCLLYFLYVPTSLGALLCFFTSLGSSFLLEKEEINDPFFC